MNNTSDSGSYSFELYRYTPSIPAAVIFAAIFFALAAFHLVRLFRHRTYFFVPFIVGLLCRTPVSIYFC